MDKRFLHSPRVRRVGPPFVTPTSLAEQNSSPHLRRSAGPPIASDPNSFPPSELLPYDTFEKKSVQQLLYEVYSKRCFFPYNLTWNVSSMIRALKHDLILPTILPTINGINSLVNSKQLSIARHIANIWSKI
jgi:hypothetical protein